jgi:hypothetical protein
MGAPAVVAIVGSGSVVPPALKLTDNGHPGQLVANDTKASRDTLV